jgi:hypothetical protein
MAFKVTISVLSESQEGDIGDDWKFDLGVKIFNEGLKDEGTIKVKKHNLPAGVIQDPPGPPEPLVLTGGDAEGEMLVRLKLLATEVDLFQNDSGEVESDLPCPCPSSEDGISAHQTELSVGVRESPGFLNQVSVFTLKLRVVIERV